MEIQLTEQMVKTWSVFAPIEVKREEIISASQHCFIKSLDSESHDIPPLWSISTVEFEKVCYALLLRDYLHLTYPIWDEKDPWSITDEAANRALSYEKQLQSTAAYCTDPDVGARASHVLADWKKLCEMLRYECEMMLRTMNDPVARLWRVLRAGSTPKEELLQAFGEALGNGDAQ